MIGSSYLVYLVGINRNLNKLVSNVSRTIAALHCNPSTSKPVYMRGRFVKNSVNTSGLTLSLRNGTKTCQRKGNSVFSDCLKRPLNGHHTCIQCNTIQYNT